LPFQGTGVSIESHSKDLLDPIRHEGGESRKQHGDGGQDNLDPEGEGKASLQGITSFLPFDNGGCPGKQLSRTARLASGSGQALGGDRLGD
jgi:hypothetical protein